MQHADETSLLKLALLESLFVCSVEEKSASHLLVFFRRGHFHQGAAVTSAARLSLVLRLPSTQVIPCLPAKLSQPSYDWACWGFSGQVFVVVSWPSSSSGGCRAESRGPG